MTRTRAEKITAEAEGVYPAEAAAQLITSALDGHLVDRLPLAWETDTMAEIDWEAAVELPLGGGARRMVKLARSLATGHPVDLSDATTGLDEPNARTVLVALSRALRVRIHGGAR